MNEHQTVEHRDTRTIERPPFKNRVSARFITSSVILFFIVILVMAAAMYMSFQKVIGQLSVEYAIRYAANSAHALSTHVSIEAALMSKAAQSESVLSWVEDEMDETKKQSAFNEMASIVGELYSYNLYIGIESSRNEYCIERSSVFGDLTPFAVLQESSREDSWFFDCIESENTFLVTIGIDHVRDRKRVWLDYKVERDGKALAVICTGLEFAHITRELFSGYDGESTMRGLVVDRAGIIQMDSTLMDNSDFLYSVYETKIEDALLSEQIVSMLQAYLDGTEAYPQEYSEPITLSIPTGQYQYMSIAPIAHTDWSVVILSGVPPRYDVAMFFPVSMIVLALFVLFVIATSVLNHRLVFSPLDKLEESLVQLAERQTHRVYGIDRKDEFGSLSRAILDLYDKANIDALTGLHNRRFLCSALTHIMGVLFRSNSTLSVLMVDVDYFKKYNDTYGHEQGDVCLREVAKVLQSSVRRASDFVVRYGGEEFVVILPNADEASAQTIAQMILENVRNMKMPHINSDVAQYLTVSVGATTGFVRQGDSWESYVHSADEALYAAKQGGRDRYAFQSHNY